MNDETLEKARAALLTHALIADHPATTRRAAELVADLAAAEFRCQHAMCAGDHAAHDTAAAWRRQVLADIATVTAADVVRPHHPS